MMGLEFFLRGSIYIVFETSGPERVINALRVRIPIKMVKVHSQNRFSFVCYYCDRSVVYDILTKYSANIILEKHRGLPIFVSKYYKRTGLVIGAVAFLSMLYVSSLLVWEIRVEGNEKISDEDICARLASFGFHEGVFKKSVDLDKLHLDYLTSDKRISWIAINFEGTLAHVEVKEAKLPPEKLDKSKISNIVAKRDGIIVRVDALDGGKVVESGEVVTKGQLLICAFMETRKSGFVLRSARGSVYAKTERTFEAKIPKGYYEKEYTGKQFTEKSLIILGKTIPLNPLRNCNYEYFDFEKSIKQVFVTENIKLPMKIQTRTKKEYIPVKKSIPPESAFEKAHKDLEEKIESQLSGAEILSVKYDEQQTEDYYVVKAYIECIEDIAKEVDFVVDEPK